MKCLKCNYETDGTFYFCPNCGKEVEKTAAANDGNVQPEFFENPSYFKAPDYLKSGLFMTICILMTVGTALKIISGSISVLEILFSIFLWLIYSSARDNNPLYAQRMRLVSGTIFAGYVINWVLFGIIAFCGLILAIAFGVGVGSLVPENAFSEFANAFSSSLYDVEVTEELVDTIETVAQFGLSTIILFAAIVMLVAALTVALFNIFGIRSIHKFSKSLYLCESGATNMLVKPNAAKNWILVFGILEGISVIFSVSNKSALLSCGGGCISAAYIVAFVLLNKHLKNSEPISAQ